MSGARALLLALLLARLPARLPARGLGPAAAATAELAAGAARRAAPRSQDAASGRAAAAAAPGSGAPGSSAQLPAAGPRRGRPAPPLRRRPRAARAALRRPDRHRPPGVSGLRGPAASRRSGGSRSVSQVCVEKSLVFRSNTPYATDIVAVPGGRDLLFCVQLDDSKLNYFQQPQDIKESDFVKFLEKYGRHSFSAPSQVQPSSSAFYRAGDPILIYFDSSSALSTLRQPVKMGASGLCVDGNPAGFLDSKSTSCTRIFANLSKSCVTDPALDAASYYRDFSVLKVPVNDTIVQSMKVKVTAVAAPGVPHMKDNTCHNVVSQVIYEIEFSGTRGIQSVSVRFKVGSVSGSAGSALQQRFTFRFWTRTLSHTLPRSGNPGYLPEAALLTARSGATQHMSVLQSEGDGSCSRFLRHTVQFGRNTRTGCKLSLSQTAADNTCSQVQQQLHGALRGLGGADVAVTGSARSGRAEEWTPILIHNCSVQAVNCTSCCMVPVTLEIQILWTNVGLLSNPQAQILGARYLYQCQPLKFLSTSAVPLAAVVTFTDVTAWPEPPRDQPRVHWRLPFDIFFPFKVAVNFERSYRGATCKPQRSETLRGGGIQRNRINEEQGGGRS